MYMHYNHIYVCSYSYIHQILSHSFVEFLSFSSSAIQDASIVISTVFSTVALFLLSLQQNSNSHPINTLVASYSYKYIKSRIHISYITICKVLLIANSYELLVNVSICLCIYSQLAIAIMYVDECTNQLYIAIF